MQSMFAHYMLIPAPPQDDLWAIWKRVRADMDVPAINPFKPNALAEMNFKINRQITFKLEDHWQTPKGTLQLGTGDCKDYATLKYAVLRASGVNDENDLCVVVGHVRTVAHAFAMVESNEGWHVLDNLFDQVTVHPDDYVNFTPLKLLSGESVYLFSPIVIIGEGAHVA